ncbi:MAG: glycerol kinase GlpK [Candidatus Omnitrophota bacterium]
MPRKYILSIDQGTTGSRAFIIDQSGKVVGSAYQEFRQYFPRPGWVEHDASEIWDSVCRVIKLAVKKSKINRSQVAAIGITNQRETTVLWDRKTSKPAARAIVWQCRRTSDICTQLKKYEPMFRKKTGLVLDAYFSGTKVKWLLDHVKGLRGKAKKGGVCFGTIDSWLIWKLTGGQSHMTDMTNASRTLIFNIKNFKWDGELLRILNIPPSVLPQVQDSGSIFGYTDNLQTGLPKGIPITAVMGDQQAALYGQGCYEVGSVKNTYGTGCFMVLNTGKKMIHSKGGLLTTLASDLKGKPVYALEGSVFIAGAVIQWLRDQLKIIRKAADVEPFIKGLKNTNGVYFVPAFVGLGAPYWDSQAKGIICGLTRGANDKHIIRAAVESMAYQTKDVFDLMKKELGRFPRELKVDGGACKNNFLMQFQADMLNCKIVRPKNVDSTVLGAAHLAGIVAGVWKGKKDLDHMHAKDKIFLPKMKEKTRTALYHGWRQSVKQARSK